MAKKPDNPDKQLVVELHIRLRGKQARDWLAMLDAAGGKQQYHGISACEDYCKKKKQEG